MPKVIGEMVLTSYTYKKVLVRGIILIRTLQCSSHGTSIRRKKGGAETRKREIKASYLGGSQEISFIEKRQEYF